MPLLKDQVALVTGASSGIGAGVARAMAAAGAKVVVNYAGNPKGAEEVVDKIQANGGIAIAIKADVSQENEVKHMFAETIEKFGTNDGTILEFAEANNINPPYSCRAGICLSCMCKIKEGEVEYITPPTGTPDEGSVLICISQPKTPKVVLDV